MNPRVYLDYNATAPLRPEAREAMLAVLEKTGNASSIHAEGRGARGMLERAREKLAVGVGTAARNLVFTSGATEAANLALTPHLRDGRDAPPFDLLLIAAGEHACVLKGHRFPPAGGDPAADAGRRGFAGGARPRAARPRGPADHARLAGGQQRDRRRLAGARGGGACPRGGRAAGLRRDPGHRALALQHSRQLDADVLLFSSHKLGGPAGAGALAFSRGDLHIDETVLRGGGQEGGRRAGTENVAAAVVLRPRSKPRVSRRPGLRLTLGVLRDDAERRVAAIVPDAVFLGAAAARLSNTSAFLAPGIAAHTLAMALDLEGVAVSTGSACSSGKPSASHVALAMGFEGSGDAARSLGWRSTAKDVESFGIALARVVDRIRSRRSVA